MNDHDVEERLTRDANRYRNEDFRPPSLDSMLDVAVGSPRHRRTWFAVAASVLVVGGIAMAVPLVRSSSGGNPSSAASAAAAPSTINRNGTTLRYVGTEAWSNPVLDETDPSVVYIYAGVDGGMPDAQGNCTVTPVARVESQTETSVTIAVAKYDDTLPSPGTFVACPLVAHGAARLQVELAQPLGTRSLVDAQDGATHAVLDPATVLAPTYLPDGYSGGQATWGEWMTGAAMRQYQGPGSNTLTITVGPASLNRHDSHIVSKPTVRGHPATVSYSPGFAEDILVAWSEDATRAVTVYQTSSYDPTHPPLSADELVRVANSLR